MKKILSIIVAIALVFTMGVCAFAAEKPTGTPADPAALGAYYAEALAAGDPATVAAEIIADFQAGVITVDTLPDVLSAFSESATGTVDMTAIQETIDAVLAGLGELDVTLPDMGDVTLPDISTPDVSLPDGGDITLPDDSGSTGGGFLDTILGALTGIIDGILGGGSGDNGGSGDGGNTDDSFEDDDDFSAGDEGDTSIIAVSAVALVAGAALVLTRKKKED